jgi:hypothetical protein
MKDFRTLVTEAIGEASVCWDEKGVFQSERALEVVDRIVARHQIIVAELEERSNFLYALEAAGVDNWDGYSYAHEIIEAEKEGREPNI